MTGGAYVTFESYIPRLGVSGLDLSVDNQIYSEAKPKREGSRSSIVRMGSTNNGATKIPDAYFREGYNATNLRNHEWNECVQGIDAITHNKIEEISLNTHRYGKNVPTGDNMYFKLKNIYLQEVESDMAHGWQYGEERVAYFIIEYFMNGGKTAIMNTDAEAFEIVHAADGPVVYQGDIRRVRGQAGEFGVIDFTELRMNGEYQIWFGSTETETLHTGQNILAPSPWKLINFLYYGRRGYPAPNYYGAYHQDVYTDHNGVRMISNGGWHDAVDVSQQIMQSAEIPDAMMTSAKETRKFDEMLYLKTIEEANWGLDFILRMCFGDGYRISHVVLRRWTDGLIDNMDGAIADVDNRSSENFMFAAVETGAAKTFGERDPELAWKYLDVTREDFMFADKRFRKIKLEKPHMVEHTAGTSLSQYYSATTWAAARLYEMTKEDRLVAFAKRHADKIVTCQETGDETPMNGYFYRDETKKYIAHSPHQTRDHVLIVAPAEICKALKGHEKAEVQEQAMKLRGGYLKKPKVYTQPYGMLPAGIHYTSGIDDKATSDVPYPTAGHEAEKANCEEQLESGIDFENGYYIRRFLVWFSYRGNLAIQLSTGKAASALGRYFDDRELIEIGREQLYWTLGKSLFTQSLIYGENDNYDQEYAALLDEAVGEMPVGV